MIKSWIDVTCEVSDYLPALCVYVEGRHLTFESYSKCIKFAPQSKGIKVSFSHFLGVCQEIEIEGMY